jgi:alpha-mannosidase
LWLQEKFQKTPKTGWQIDPFGNFASTPIIFALCGFTDTVTDRISVSTTLSRIEKGAMEYIWRPPVPYFQEEKIRNETSIFTHQLGLLLYEGFPFVFENSDSGSGADPVTPDNLEVKVLEFYSSMDVRYKWYEKGNSEFLLFPWGGDFLFYNASQEFSNFDKILRNVVNASYATVPKYFEALRGMKKNWPEREGEGKFLF